MFVDIYESVRTFCRSYRIFVVKFVLQPLLLVTRSIHGIMTRQMQHSFMIPKFVVIIEDHININLEKRLIMGEIPLPATRKDMIVMIVYIYITAGNNYTRYLRRRTSSNFGKNLVLSYKTLKYIYSTNIRKSNSTNFPIYW